MHRLPSRRVGSRKLTEEPVAFFQDLIDLVDRLDAPAWRPAIAQRSLARGTALLFGFCEQARIALGLALHVCQRVHDCEEPPAQALGIDGAVIDGLHRSGRRWRGCRPAAEEPRNMRVGGIDDM